MRSTSTRRGRDWQWARPRAASGFPITAAIRGNACPCTCRRSPVSDSNKENAMRFMIIVKATKDSEAGVMPGEDLIAKMVAYHEALHKAGVLRDGSGLQASSKGWRIK